MSFGRFYDLIVGLNHLYSPLRIFSCNDFFNKTSRSIHNQHTKLALTSMSRFGARKPISLRISAQSSFQNMLYCPSRNSYRCTNKFCTRAKAEDLTLAARLKKLSREYGWSAFGVYLALSALDFPICYILVRYLGTDKIGEWEHMILSSFKSLIPDEAQKAYTQWCPSIDNLEQEPFAEHQAEDNMKNDSYMKGVINNVRKADQEHKKDASMLTFFLKLNLLTNVGIATQLALAYAIHKSFIFFRVPLTAAITPKIVKTLREWGWDIGKRTTKQSKLLRKATLRNKSQSSSNK